MRWFERSIDLCFLFDVLLNFRTTYVDDVVHREVTDASRIARRYLSTWCAIDVFSSVPFDWFFPQLFAGLGGLTRMSKLLKVARVLKVFKLLQLTSKDNAFTEIFEEMLYTSDMADYLTLLKLTLATTFVGHIMGCLWAAVARGSRTSWQFGYFDGDDDGDGDGYGYNVVDDRWHSWRAYLACFYWAMTTITTVGYGDICPDSDSERVYAILAMVIGGAFYGYIIGNISSNVTATDANSRAYYEKMDLIHTYMTIRRFPRKLRRKVHRHFKKYFEERTALDETAILNDLAPGLRQEVGKFLLRDTVRGHFFYQYLPRGMLSKLVPLLKPCTGEIGRALVSEGAVGTAMWILEAGACDVCSRYYTALLDERAERPDAPQDDADEVGARAKRRGGGAPRGRRALRPRALSSSLLFPRRSRA